MPFQWTAWWVRQGVSAGLGPVGEGGCVFLLRAAWASTRMVLLLMWNVCAPETPPEGSLLSPFLQISSPHLGELTTPLAVSGTLTAPPTSPSLCVTLQVQCTPKSQAAAAHLLPEAFEKGRQCVFTDTSTTRDTAWGCHPPASNLWVTLLEPPNHLALRERIENRRSQMTLSFLPEFCLLEAMVPAQGVAFP